MVLPLTFTLTNLTLSALDTLIVDEAMCVKVLLLTVTFLMWLDGSPDSLMANGAPSFEMLS